MMSFFCLKYLLKLNDMINTLTNYINGANKSNGEHELKNMAKLCATNLQAKFDVFFCFLKLKLLSEPETNLEDLEAFALKKIYENESEEMRNFYINIYYAVENNCQVKISKLKEELVEDFSRKKTELSKMKMLICEKCISKVNKQQEFALSYRVNFINTLLNRCLFFENQCSVQDKIGYLEKIKNQIENMKTYHEIETYLIDLINSNNFKNWTLLSDQKTQDLFKNNYGNVSCSDELFEVIFTNSNSIFSKIIRSTNLEQAEYLELALRLLNSVYFNSLNQQEKIESFRIELLQSCDQRSEKNVTLIEQLNQIMIKSSFRINHYQNYEHEEWDNDFVVFIEKIDLIFKSIQNFFNDANIVVFNDKNVNVSKVKLLLHVEQDLGNLKKNLFVLAIKTAIDKIEKIVNKINQFVSDNFKNSNLMELRTRIENLISSKDSKLIIKELKIGNLYLLDNDIFYLQTSLIYTYLVLSLEEIKREKKINQACYEHLKKNISYLRQYKDLRLGFYSFHYLVDRLNAGFGKTDDQFTQIDSWFMDLMCKIFVLDSSQNTIIYLNKLIDQLDNSNVAKYFTQLDFILPLLSSNSLDMLKIKNALFKLANTENTFCDDVCIILLEMYNKHTSFTNDKLNLFMKRILNSAKKNKNKLLIKFYFDCDNYLRDNNSIKNLPCIKNYLCDILSTYEQELCKYIGTDLVINNVLDKHCDYIWGEIMEGMFISKMSRIMLTNEQNLILNEIQDFEDYPFLENKLKQLVECSYYTQCNQTFQYLKSQIKTNNKGVLDSIKNFKTNLILSNEILTNKLEWTELIYSLAYAKIDLKNKTKLLSMCKYYFPNEKKFIELVKNCEPTYLTSNVLLESVKNLFSTILSHSSTNFERDLASLCNCMDSNFIEGDTDNDYYLEWLAAALLDQVSKKNKLQLSEIEAIKKMLENSFCLGLNQSGGNGILNTLEKLPILKWNAVIRTELVKRELNRPDCDKLAADIVYLEDVRGSKLVQELMLVFKSVALDQFTLATVVKKFKKNEWDLNFNMVKKMKNTKPIDWIKTISEYDQNEKKKEMSVKELIELMRQKEAPNEANYTIRNLLDASDQDNQCLLEKALIKIKQKSKSTIDLEIDKNFVEFDSLDVKKWTNSYKQLSKISVDSILCDEVIELCCVLSRGSKLIFGYELRSTQLIAVLLFIDAMLNRRGRLANISTGEGKSVITIVTTIAHLLIRGGTVDILTSSELLAERDAIESHQFFDLFEISVSNNCDMEASQNETVRQNRYQNNQVIYGVIGNFQRDLLLTKYYGKPIRKELATCLIVDEVDSMCIDNMCNTLYISHQIADLKYLKDVYVYIWQAVNMFDTAEYTVSNVDKIKSFIELKIKEKNIVYPSSLQEMIDRKIKMWIENAYLAKTNIHEGDQYSIISKGRQTGQAVINDLQTGVEQLNTQWSDGLQQFIQLKHYNKLNEESLKSIFMSNYIFFKQYNDNIFGMTGTLGASQERDLLSNAYGLDFFHLPRFKKELNVRHDDFVLATRSAWLNQIKTSVDFYLANNRTIDTIEIEESKNKLQFQLDKNALLAKSLEDLDDRLRAAKLNQIELEKNLDQKEDIEKNANLIKSIETELNCHKKQKEENDLCIENSRDVLGEDKSRNSGGRSVLIICKNKKDVNDVVRNLLVKNKHLYDFYGKLDGLRRVEGVSKRIGTEIRQLRPGDIVVATNVAGRGTDFKLSDLLLKNGGLHVILSYVPDNERVELQAFGRSGRKGQPGSGNIIVYDKRLLSNHELNVDYLKQERDSYEEERLMEIRNKMIPRVIIEKKLFEKFELLQDKVKQFMEAKSTETKFNELQTKSLHNKWAFWLEKNSSLINNVYRSSEIEVEIFDCFDKFANQILNECIRDQNGIQGLIDEPGELIKLAKYNILNDKFNQAIQNCDAIIDNNCLELCAFAYLYKAIALFQPVNGTTGIQFVDDYFQNFNGGSKIVSDKIKQEGKHLLKMTINLFEKEIQRIQMRSQVLCKIGQENIKSGIGSKADHFSKSNANEISVIQIHLNAAQSALKSSIDTDKLSNCLNGSKFFNWMADLDGNKTQEAKKQLFDAVLNDCQLKNLIKRKRFSKKSTVKCHVNFKKREKLVRDIVGQEVDKADRKGECFVFNRIDLKILEKLKLNHVDFSHEIYISDLIEPSGLRHVKLPSQFFYLKEKLVKQLENVCEKSTDQRQSMLVDLSNECMSIDKAFDAISQTFGLENTKCVYLHNQFDKCSNNESFWSNDVFGKWGNLIRTVLIETFDESNKCAEHFQLLELIRTRVVEEQNNLDIHSADIDAEKIINFLSTNDCLCFKDKFKFSNEKQVSINEFRNNFIFKKHVNSANIRKIVGCIDFGDFRRLEDNKEKIVDFFEKKLAQFEYKIGREEFDEAIFGQQTDEYSFGFLKVLLTLNQCQQDLHEFLSIDLASSGLDQNEIVELNKIALELFDLKYFDKESINLAHLDTLIEYFVGEKVIKEKNFRFKYESRPDTFAENLSNQIKNMAKEHATKLIDKYIDNGQYLTDSDLKQLKSKFMDKFVKETIFRYDESDILKSIKENERTDSIEETVNLIESSLMETIGFLFLNEKCYITCNLLNEVMKETSMPREAYEFVQDDKDLVISFKKYTSPWSWKAAIIMALGLVQICAGCLFIAYPILGPFSYHVGSGLISEGCGDIMFALNNAGNINTLSYLKHKGLSMLITCVCVGIGGYLSRASSVAAISGKTIQEQAARLGVQFVTKEGSFLVSRAIAKKVMLEVSKCVIDYFKGISANILSSLTSDFLRQMLRQFSAKIISLIRQDNSYNDSMNKLSHNIKKLATIVKQKSYRQSTKQILDEKLKESIQQHNDSLNNRIESMLGQVAGPLSSQIEESAKVVQYSGLTVNDQKQMGNNWANFLSKIATLINKVMKLIKAINIAYDIICTGRDIAKLTSEKIDKKITKMINNVNRNNYEDKLSGNYRGELDHVDSQKVYENQPTVLIETRSLKSERNVQDKEEKQEDEAPIENEIEASSDQADENEKLDIEKHVENVNQHILDTIYRKIELNIVKPAFSSLINFSLSSLYKKLDDCLGQDLENLKKRSLAYGEYENRVKNNPEETGIEIDMIKDFLINELNNLPLDSPVFETKLEDVQTGQVNIVVNGKMKVLDLSNPDDRQFIRDHIGAKGIRFFTTQNGINLSRPNFVNYISSISPEKRFTKYDLSLLAQKYNMNIKVITDNGEEAIESDQGDAKGEIFVSLKDGHFEPMVKVNNKFVLVSDLASPDNQCGPYAFLYAMKMNNLMSGKNNNVSFEQADQEARKHIDQQVEMMVQDMQEYALNSENAWQLFTGREHEGTSIVGGNKRIQNTLPSDDKYFDGKKIEIKQIKKDDIENDIQEVKKKIDESIEKAEEYKEDSKDALNFEKHNKHKPTWNKINEKEYKTQMMIGFAIIKTKDGQVKKLFFASGNEALCNKEKIDGTRENLELKTKGGFEFINQDFTDKGKTNVPCAAKKALLYAENNIGLSNIESFELGEIMYEYKNDGNRNQPNMNGQGFAKPCDNCSSYFEKKDQNANSKMSSKKNRKK